MIWETHETVQFGRLCPGVLIHCLDEETIGIGRQTPNPLQAPDRPPGSGAGKEEEKKPYKNDNETYVRVIKQIYQKQIENQTTMMIKDKTELLCSKIAPNISYSEVSYT